MIYYQREGNIKKRTSHLWPRLWSMRHKIGKNGQSRAPIQQEAGVDTAADLHTSCFSFLF